MRSTSMRRSVLLGTILLGASSNAPAGDELFLPSYQRMGLIPGSPAPAPAPIPAPVPAQLPPGAGPTAPVVRPQASGRPRLTTWPNQVQQHQHEHQHHHQTVQTAPAVAPSSRPHLGRRSPAPVDPFIAPVVAATAGPSVAATLTSPAGGGPDAAPSTTRGMLARFRKAEPLVPPGRPRGSQPAEMTPPEPLGADPLMAELAGSSARRPSEPDRGEVASDAMSQGVGLAARPDASEVSPFAPVSARDRLDGDPHGAEATIRRPSRAIPPLIARPAEVAADSPLRRVQGGEAGLDRQAAPIDDGLK